MATKNSKTDEQELAKSISSQEVIYNVNNLEIKYLNPEDSSKFNGIYAGQDLWLIAELSPDEIREDYTYTWNIDKGEFKGAYKWSIDKSKLILVSYSSKVDNLIYLEAQGGYIVCIATNAVNINDNAAGEIIVNVEAKSSEGIPTAPAPPLLSLCESQASQT